MIAATRKAIERRKHAEANDAALFAERLGLQPDTWQVDLLRSGAKQMILNCSRQSGKSTVTRLAEVAKRLK